MSIPPTTESPEWDEYPLDTTPLPEPTAPDRTHGIAPMVMAGAVLGMLIIAAFLAITYSGDDDDTIDTGADRLPFTASSVDDTPASTEPPAPPDEPKEVESVAVRWPDDFGWEESTVPYWSGCTPGTTDTLPDGVWFGYVVDVRPATIDFDLACHYGIGREFISDDPDEPDFVDVYLIENENAASRELTMSASLEVHTFSNDTGPIGPISGIEYLENGRLDGLPDAVITIENGFVTEIRHRPDAG